MSQKSPWIASTPFWIASRYSYGDESQLSDTALIEQLAIAYCKARNKEGNAIALGLLREIAARIGLSGSSL